MSMRNRCFHHLIILPLLLMLSLSLSAAGGNEPGEVVNVYSHRHYDADQDLFDRFTEETGIQVNVILASADELIERLRAEGEASPADLLITVDASRLARASSLGLLQPVDSEVLDDNIPGNLRSDERLWFGLTRRARVIAYDRTRTEPDIDSYADLADPAYRDRILIRSSSNIYNISLLSAIIAHEGEAAAENWARGVVGNMARPPQGNDRDQMKAVIAGEGDFAVVNTYYVGLLLNSDDPGEREVGEKIGIIFPDQNGRGTHVNISGAGVTAHAPNRDNAVRLLEFLSGAEAQAVYARENFEFPANPAVEPGELILSWGSFLEDDLDLTLIGENNSAALRIFDEAGWN
jgi:iron(III) transport system substrate-binding protein